MPVLSADHRTLSIFLHPVFGMLDCRLDLADPASSVVFASIYAVKKFSSPITEK